MSSWNFWIDRGGTFTDIIAKTPNGKIVTKKILSENEKIYEDSITFGIKTFLKLTKDQKIPSNKINSIKIGTTLGTNALLEGKGERFVLITTKGFKDQLDIAYQNRNDIFSRKIIKTNKLYEKVVEAKERTLASGLISKKLDKKHLKNKLKKIKKSDIKSCAIVFMHSYKNNHNEKVAFKIAKKLGFKSISVSHKISETIKIVPRGDTTVLDAYLSPIIRKYIKEISKSFDRSISKKCQFIKSDAGLVFMKYFQGKDSILSGPAAGVLGAIDISKNSGENKIIGFDMGGTSTDVCHFSGNLERSFNTQINGIRISVPSISINTVAAGGGSKLFFKNGSFKVGPESVGANPGPVCYDKGGDLSITDANVVTGKIRSEFFPKIFGLNGKKPLNCKLVFEKFEKEFSFLKKNPENIAEGFIKIANESMANAIKKISIQKGYKVSDYCLTVYGGAGGQHACSISEILGIKKCLVHYHASLLSAYGISVADLRSIKSKTIEKKLDKSFFSFFSIEIKNLKEKVKNEIFKQMSKDKNIFFEVTFHLKSEGSDTTFQVTLNSFEDLEKDFKEAHFRSFGFFPMLNKIIVESITVEGRNNSNDMMFDKKFSFFSEEKTSKILSKQNVFFNGSWMKTNIYNIVDLKNNEKINGPSILLNESTSIVINPGWFAKVNNSVVKLTFIGSNNELYYDKNVMLEVFNNSYVSIAEQMGAVLEKTSKSITIKERLDFSCAIFSPDGSLIANAPHIPVHLGSMDSSIKSLLKEVPKISEGDFYATNDPFSGGTHLSDITVISPVFSKEKRIVFFVAARGHHTDVGGITPGSMPPKSKSIEEEGILLKNWLLVSKGKFREKETKKKFSSGVFPARSVYLNIADLKAQIAACNKGIIELQNLIDFYGQRKIEKFLKILRDNAKNIVLKSVREIKNKSFGYFMDEDSKDNIRKVSVSLNFDKIKNKLIIDFTGSSKQQNNNFNAPKPVAKAAIIYSLRLLTAEEIPINAGFMDPIEVIFPSNSILSPKYPAAVTAGNVETSQAITSAILLALEIQAASQSTMNNLTWGNSDYQYYETICGGTGAGYDERGNPYKGISGVQSHMTNSRLTDPEILESRFPVIIKVFEIRKKSGGKGDFFGGNGVKRKFLFLEKMKISILSGHRKRGTPGLHGGGYGKKGKQFLILKSGKHKELQYSDESFVNKGDKLIIMTPGGGGLKN